MARHNNQPTHTRGQRSELDRHVIHVAAQLLFAGIRIERLVTRRATFRSGPHDVTSWRGPSARLAPTSLLPLNQPRNEDS